MCVNLLHHLLVVQFQSVLLSRLTLSSMFLINDFASSSKSLYDVTPAQFGNRTSNFVMEICVALLSMTARLAKSKSNSAARLSRPVTVPNSSHPFLDASSAI